RMKLPKFCPQCDRECSPTEIVKGYQYAKNEYVYLTQDEIESIPRPSAHTIDLQSFCDAGDIDPVYFEKTYNVEPEATGKKAYALLVHALRGTGRIGIGQIAMRGRERLCAIRSD